MLIKRLPHKQGFTLVEIMVVIVIIVMMAGMALPTMSDFMRQRRLKGASNIIQSLCIESRSRAIAQRERQYVLVIVTTGTYTPASPVTGVTVTNAAKGSVYSFDSNSSVTGGTPQLVSMETLPEFIKFDAPAANFTLVFASDGTVSVVGFTPNNNDPDASNSSDVIFAQDGITTKSYMQFIPNTGRVRTSVRNPL